MLNALSVRQKGTLLKAFPKEAFDVSTLVKFTQGWSLCEGDFVEWASDKPISIEQFKHLIHLPIADDFKVPPELIQKEQDARRMLVTHISSMYLSEVYGKRTEFKSILTSEGQAVTRTMLLEV